MNWRLLPISPLIPLLYYRGDLYKEAGLKAPETFAELEANARKLHKPPGRYGIVQRGARGPASVSYDFYPYLFGYGGGSVFGLTYLPLEIVCRLRVMKQR